MMDSELGYHPNHPSVRSGFVESSRGWDGEYGPFVEVVAGRRFINAASIRRSDYVTNALRQRIDIRKTSGVDSQELIRRMEALRFAITVLPPPGDHVSNTKLWLVQAESIDEWRQDPRRVDAALIGRGLVYVFAKYNNRQTPKRTSDLTRLRYTFEHLFECRISDTIILTRKETRAWKKFDIEKVKLGHRILAA
jgi:hypothetical protein